MLPAVLRRLFPVLGTLLALALPAAAPAATVSVDPERPGHRVPAGFLGLSVEWDSLEDYARGRRAAALSRLLAPIRRSQRGLSLRVGGNSGDASWWNPEGRRRPRIVLHDLSPRTLDALSAVAGALGGPVALGVNLALRDPENALALLAAAEARLPPGRLDAVELGNEPDLYTAAKTFRVPGRVHRRVRKRRYYDSQLYGRDVTRYLDVIDGALSSDVEFSVAGFARPFWWSSVPSLLTRWGGRARVLGVHMYALPYCDAPPPPGEWLMTDEASRGLAAKIEPIARLARRRDLEVRVTEMNSAVCGGRAGISNTSLAAVWLADILFALLNRGVDQAHVHTWHRAVYAPFAVNGTGVRSRPPLNGMLAFARAAPAGSRIVATRTTGGVRAWATRDRAGAVRVAILAPRGGTVRVRAPRRTCRSVWAAGPRGRATRPCARTLSLGPRSIAVVTLERR